MVNPAGESIAWDLQACKYCSPSFIHLNVDLGGNNKKVKMHPCMLHYIKEIIL